MQRKSLFKLKDKGETYMYFKFVFKELKNNWFMNVIIILQMIVVFICTMSTASIASYFYNYYNDFSSYYESKGDFYFFSNVVVDSVVMESSDTIETKLEKADIICTYKPWAVYFDSNNEEIHINTMAYDTEFIEAYEPELKEGRWINPHRADGIVEAVILENDYGLTVGTKIQMYDVYMQQPDNTLTVEIVGIIEDGTRIVGSVSGWKNIQDYRDIYTDYYFEEEGAPILLTSIYSINCAMEKEDNHSLQRSMGGIMFVVYDDDITLKEIAHNERTLGNIISDYTKKSLSAIKENSLLSIKEKLYSILPIFICVFILVLITAMCSFAISVKKHMREYTILSICGMPWNKSSLICILKSIIMSIIALTISIVLVFLVLEFEIIKETTLQLSFISVLACITVGIIYVLISAIMPSALIKGTSLNSELKDNI